MRTVSILLSEVPDGYRAERAGTGTDGTLKLVPGPDPVVLRSELDDLERRYRLLLAWVIETFGTVPPGLEDEAAPALEAVGG